MPRPAKADHDPVSGLCGEANLTTSPMLRLWKDTILHHAQLHWPPRQVPEQHRWVCKPIEKAQAAMSA